MTVETSKDNPKPPESLDLVAAMQIDVASAQADGGKAPLPRFTMVAYQYDFAIDVAVQKKFETGDAAELDPLMSLVEEIADFFRLRRLAAYPDAVWVRTDNVPVYAPEHMEEYRQFTSVLTLTFRVVR